MKFFLLAALLWPLGIFPETIPNNSGNLTSLANVEQCPSGVYSCTLIECLGQQDCNTCTCLPGPDLSDPLPIPFSPRAIALPWPAPCEDPGTCWLAWQWRIGEFQVWSGETQCAVIPGRRRQNGSWINPRPAYWPHPGDGCWRAGQSRTYRIRACTDGICGEFSEFVEFGPQDFMCFDSRGQIPCY